jgi:RNase P subunit RPR2
MIVPFAAGGSTVCVLQNNFMRIPRIEADSTGIWNKMQAITKCSHPSHTARKKTASNGVISVWKQCDKCGDKLASIPKKTLTADQVEALVEWDETIAQGFYKGRQELHQKMMDDERARAKAEWQRLYEEYLKSAEWQERRQLVLLRAQGICEGCRKAPATSVHHLHYRDAGEEFLWQLVAICDVCHERYHAPLDEPS